MGLSLGGLAGAANALATGFSSSSSLKNFISTMDSLGVQITSRYEAIFSAIPQATFFITQLNTPGMKQNIGTMYYDGKIVEFPQNMEYEHDFSMTVINDSSGYIYSALTNLVMGETGKFLMDSGYTMSIRAIGDDNHSGSTIMLNGVRIKTIGGLSYQNAGGDVQTFDLGCSAVDFTVTPGAAQAVAGVTNAIGSLLG